MATKVTAEFTQERWVWTVYDGNQVIARHAMKLDEDWRGARGEQKGDMYDQLPDDPDLAEAIEARDEMDICKAIGKKKKAAKGG